LDLIVSVRNLLDGPADGASISVLLYNPNGRRVLDRPLRATLRIGPLGESEANLTREISDPRKWTAETPNLYTLVLRLHDQAGQLSEVVSTKMSSRRRSVSGRSR
jgi:beta-galactosidase